MYNNNDATKGIGDLQKAILRNIRKIVTLIHYCYFGNIKSKAENFVIFYV